MSTRNTLMLSLSLLTSYGLYTAQNAHAQTVPSSVDPGQFVQEPRQEIRVPQRPAEIITIPKEEAGITDASTEKIFTLNNIILKDSTTYSAEDIAPLYAEFVGQPVSFADLNTISRRITRKYRQDGYIFSSAILSPQKIKDGIVYMNVIEGRITKVDIVGDFKDNNDLIKKMAQKIENKGVTNTKELERYLLLIDDLPGISARSVLKPSKVPGGGELSIIIEQTDYEGSLSIDNRGSRSLGRYRGEGVIAGNSLFGIHDRTTLRGIITSDTDELHFLELYHEEQLGTEGLRLTARGALTDTNPGGTIENLNIEGESRLGELDLLFPLVRNRQYNINLTGGFTYLNSKTDLSDIQISEDRLRYLRAGTEFDFTDSLYGVNLLNFEFSQGLDILNATDDGVGRSRSIGEHKFSRITGIATRLQGLSDKWSALLSASGQYSWDSLLSSEQFFVGGEAYGRAYDSGEISGDHGATGVIELRYGGPTKDSEFINSYQFYGFYDIGKVWNRESVVGENKSESLASAGLGVRFNVAHDISGYLEVNAPLTHDVGSEGSDGDDPRIFFRLLKRF